MRKTPNISPLSISIKAALLISGALGLWETLMGPGMMQGRALMYFTTQSNILMLAVTLVFLCCGLTRPHQLPPRWLWQVKYMATVALALTYMVFHLALMPWMASLGRGSYYWSMGNMGTHVLTPLLALLDWALFTPAKAASYARPTQGLLPPLCYVLFLRIANAAGLSFSGGARTPYFFLNVKALGWFSLGGGQLGVFWWLLLITGLIWLLAKAVSRLPREAG